MARAFSLVSCPLLCVQTLVIRNTRSRFPCSAAPIHSSARPLEYSHALSKKVTPISIAAWAMRVAASMDSARASVAPPRASEDTISSCRPNLRFGTGPLAGESAASTAGVLPAITTPAPAVLSAFRKLRRCCLWGSFGIASQPYPRKPARPNPIWRAGAQQGGLRVACGWLWGGFGVALRSEEHTSELQSLRHLV